MNPAHQHPILAVNALGLTSTSLTIKDLFNAGVHVAPRAELELTNSYRQVIPYVVFTRGDEVLLYSRTKQGGEAKLFDKCSIGFGGHIDQEVMEFDVNTLDGFRSAIVTSMHRELVEEVYPGITKDQCIWAAAASQARGLLLLDTNPEDRHVGILCTIEVTDEELTNCTGDHSIENRHWVKLDTLLENEAYPGLELWSRVAVQTLS